MFVCAIALTALLAIAFIYRNSVRVYTQQVLAQLQPAPDQAFPNIDESLLNGQELKLLKILQTEYAKKPVSFDENVLNYSEGEKQPWCANFVSWVMREVGSPYVNPNSGSWRIPGVYTLREYYQSEKRYVKAGAYTPTFGDVAIYDKTPTNSHTNIVISVDKKAKTMTLIGGNENGRVRVIKNQPYSPGVRDLVGFGVRQIAD